MTRTELRIEALLTDYYEIYERQFYKGSFGVTDDINDIADAIGSANLTERQRECLRLVYLEDMKQSEAGLILGIPRQTVGFHIKAAIKKIAKAYEEENA